MTSSGPRKKIFNFFFNSNFFSFQIEIESILIIIYESMQKGNRSPFLQAVLWALKKGKEQQFDKFMADKEKPLLG